MYANPSSSLYDKLRDAKHQLPTRVDLDFNGTDPTIPDTDELIESNLSLMHKQVVGSKTAELFLGRDIKPGTSPTQSIPTCEREFNVHNKVKRPKKSTRTLKEKEDEEEVLVIEGIELDAGARFDVLVNSDDETMKPNKTEFAGSFDLGAEDDDDEVVVTMVPRNIGKEAVTIDGVKILMHNTRVEVV
ncbi:hypothetical protein Scep_011235 [Stephania cephalantha]|uniref:Polyphenol oxidase C-terminal domain-containing protein n=1 Tax=Stephania cephalantha TaxID=152367 RepID=A0AAP0P5D3_9MAGN